MASAELIEVRKRWAHLGTASDLAAMRRLFDEEGERLGMPHGVTAREVVVGGRPAEWLTPTTSGKTVIYDLHGGGYMTGSLKSYRHLAAEFARSANGRSLLLDYRLTPEHVFPVALEDALAGYRDLLKETAPEDHRVRWRQRRRQPRSHHPACGARPRPAHPGVRRLPLALDRLRSRRRLYAD